MHPWPVLQRPKAAKDPPSRSYPVKSILSDLLIRVVTKAEVKACADADEPARGKGGFVLGREDQAACRSRAVLVSVPLTLCGS